jgi:hypothetical protein
MARLSKHKRDELKSKGQWHAKPRGDEGLSFAEGAAEFTRLAEEANKMPVPFAHVIESDVVPAYPFYPDLISYQCGVMSCLDYMDEFGYDGLYPMFDDTTERRDQLASSIFLALASRVAETHGMTSASDSVQLPDYHVPAELEMFINRVGAFELDGNRFEFADASGFVKRCIRSSFFSLTYGWFEGVSGFLTPMSNKDVDFCSTISPYLRSWIYSTTGALVPERTLRQSILSGLCPKELVSAELAPSLEVWETVKPYFFAVKDGPSLRKNLLTGAAVAPLRFYGIMVPPDIEPMWGQSLRELCKQVRSLVVKPVNEEDHNVRIRTSILASPLQLVRCYVPPSGRIKYFRSPETFNVDQSLEGCAVSAVFGTWGRCEAVPVSPRYTVGFNPDALRWTDIVESDSNQDWTPTF